MIGSSLVPSGDVYITFSDSIRPLQFFSYDTNDELFTNSRTGRIVVLNSTWSFTLQIPLNKVFILSLLSESDFSALFSCVSSDGSRKVLYDVVGYKHQKYISLTPLIHNATLLWRCNVTSLDGSQMVHRVGKYIQTVNTTVSAGQIYTELSTVLYGAKVVMIPTGGVGKEVVFSYQYIPPIQGGKIIVEVRSEKGILTAKSTKMVDSLSFTDTLDKQYVVFYYHNFITGKAVINYLTSDKPHQWPTQTPTPTFTLTQIPTTVISTTGVPTLPSSPSPTPAPDSRTLIIVLSTVIPVTVLLSVIGFMVVGVMVYKRRKTQYQPLQ
ncbi:pncB [Acrasis kona]|uniref:PncB n=1 Tax=Acrasis kona TaxID=1008807 RepID=A0AAW2YKT2_9EUKA